MSKCSKVQHAFIQYSSNFTHSRYKSQKISNLCAKESCKWLLNAACLWCQPSGNFPKVLPKEKRTMTFCNFIKWTRIKHINMNVLKIIKTCAAAAKLLQSCLTLGDPIDGSPPGPPPRPWDSPGKDTGVGCHFQSCQNKNL